MSIPLQRVCVDLGNGGGKAAQVRSLGTFQRTHREEQLAVFTQQHRTVQVVDASSPVHDEETVEIRELITATLPAKVGVGSTQMGALSLGGFERRSREDKPIAMVSEEGAYLVGHHVERYTTLLERFDASKYADSPELRAVVRALLAQVTRGCSAELAVIAALPVDVMMQDHAQEIITGVERWLLGEHDFSYNGKPIHVNVRTVKAMAQPVGAFFCWGLDLAGEWARDEADLTEASVAVLDSGFNTLDLLVVKQGRIEKRETGGDQLGVRVAAQEIAQALKTRYGIHLTLMEVDAFIRQYLERGRVTPIIAGKKEELTPIVRQALQSLATQTVGFVQSKWGNARDFSYVLLAGGGALALAAPLRRHLPSAQLLPEPVLANAMGFAKLAQRRGVFKALD